MTIHEALLRSDVSHQALVSMEPHIQRLERIVLEHLTIFGGSTSDDIEGRLGMKHQTVSARLTALHKRGLIYTSGERPTSSGRMARLYWVR